MCYKVIIPTWRPALVNELLGHPLKAARRKRADADLIGIHCHLAGVPEATGKRAVRLVIVQPRGRYPDPDAVWKSLLDGLVRGRFLVDDSERHCACAPAEFRRGPLETILELEDVS